MGGLVIFERGSRMVVCARNYLRPLLDTWMGWGPLIFFLLFFFFFFSPPNDTSFFPFLFVNFIFFSFIQRWTRWGQWEREARHFD